MESGYTLQGTILARTRYIFSILLIGFLTFCRTKNRYERDMEGDIVAKNLYYLLYIALFVVTCLFIFNAYASPDQVPAPSISLTEHEQNRL